ncbi:hypothetical protein B0H17DRAFT_1210519 [Mycena rosella]|uniref:Uncharacterized protein n=1 Tax=Mycena rosella TaxID=1033263 RepID=A0AAD7G8C2_MYCRO|nr:hypothetical protein B0H17DRAFT_1210519 [Mycena rosella]
MSNTSTLVGSDIDNTVPTHPNPAVALSLRFAPYIMWAAMRCDRDPLPIPPLMERDARAFPPLACPPIEDNPIQAALHSMWFPADDWLPVAPPMERTLVRFEPRIMWSSVRAPDTIPVTPPMVRSVRQTVTRAMCPPMVRTPVQELNIRSHAKTPTATPPAVKRNVRRRRADTVPMCPPMERVAAHSRL